MTTEKSAQTIFTRSFWILCISSVLFMSSFAMVIPELPEYLNNMGGEQYVGFIIGLFTVSAAFSRLFSGRLADKVGRIKIVLFGTAITAICGGLYIFTTTIFSFLALRLFHGLATGFRPIGTSALMTDLMPAHRRAEAMGYLGVAGSLGMAAGPALGSVLKEEVSFDAMFITSSVLGVVAFIMSSLLPETLEEREPLRWSHLNIFKGQILDFGAMPAFFVTLADSFAFGVVITMSPMWVDSLGFQYKGFFNFSFILSSIAMRIFAGRSADRLGRETSILIGFILLIIGVTTIGFAESQFTVLLGGLIYGLSIGINKPSIFAWTADLASPGKIGMALATMLLALEIGIGGGSFISGEIYSGEVSRIPYTFWLAAAFSVFGLIYIYVFRRHQKHLKT